MKMAPIVISFLFLPQATSSALAAQITPTRLCEGYGGAPQHSQQPYPGMVWVPGGTFIMGDDEERQGTGEGLRPSPETPPTNIPVVDH